MRKVRKRPEQELQKSCVIWLEVQRKLGRLTYFHVPNGGYRSKREAWALKLMGVRAGIPDLVIGLPKGRLIFVELKADKGRVSEIQKEIHAELGTYGFDVHTVKSLEELMNIFKRKD